MNLKNGKIIGIAIFCIGITGCIANTKSNNIDYLMCNQTSNGRMAEIDDGYFFANDKILYYADKNNMEQWVPVCNKPDCLHKDENCNAFLPSYNVISQKDGKLYGLEYMGVEKPYVYEIAMDGSGLKNVYDIPLDVNPDGYSVSLFQDMFVLNYSYLDEHGLYQEHIISLEDDKNGGVLTTNLYGEENSVLILSGNTYWSIRGENLISTNLYLDDTSKTMKNLCKIENGEIIPLNLPEDISAYGGYMSGDIFTYYQPQEGFYEYNITTGEKELIHEKKLADGQGYILNDDCIVECNRYMDYMPEKAYLKVYNGEEWIDVELLEELTSSDDPFYPLCITSDRIFFRRTRVWDDKSVTAYLYYMMLDEKNPKLVKAGMVGAEEENENPTSKEEAEVGAYENFEEIIVFDTDEYFFKITNVYLDYSERLCIDLYFENKSENTDYQILGQHWVVNGIHCTTSWGREISAKQTVTDTVRFNSDLMGLNKLQEVYSATEYTDIEIPFYINQIYMVDSIGGTKIPEYQFLEEKTIHIYPQGEENVTYFSREPQSTDQVLIDNENISVTVIGYEETLVPNDTINVLIENKTDSIIRVKVEDGSVNGIAIEPVPYPEEYSEYYTYFAYYTYISPGAVGMYPMTLFDGGSPDGPYQSDPDSSFLTKYNITSIEEITMRLEIKEELYWDGGGNGEILLDETFTLNP